MGDSYAGIPCVGGVPSFNVVVSDDASVAVPWSAKKPNASNHCLASCLRPFASDGETLPQTLFDFCFGKPFFGDIGKVFSGSEVLIWYLFVAVSFFPGNAAIKALLIAIIWSSIFAFGLGYFVKPVDIKRSPRTKVLYESEKDKVDNVEGKVIFDLERYLLLFTYTKSVVAIPHEKIREIETLRLPVEQTPTPAVASPTSAQTSPRPTETTHVLPSPVQLPTATAESQKK